MPFKEVGGWPPEARIRPCWDRASGPPDSCLATPDVSLLGVGSLISPGPRPRGAPAPSPSLMACDILGKPLWQLPSVACRAPHLSSAVSKQSIWANTSAISSFSFCGVAGGQGGRVRGVEAGTERASRPSPPPHTTTPTPGHKSVLCLEQPTRAPAPQTPRPDVSYSLKIPSQTYRFCLYLILQGLLSWCEGAPGPHPSPRSISSPENCPALERNVPNKPSSTRLPSF